MLCKDCLCRDVCKYKEEYKKLYDELYRRMNDFVSKDKPEFLYNYEFLYFIKPFSVNCLFYVKEDQNENL